MCPERGLQRIKDNSTFSQWANCSIVYFMKFYSFSSKYTAGFLLGMAMLTCVGRAWAVEMVAHRAFYSLKLGAISQGSDFVGAQGNMGLSMERTCDGWTTSQTLRMDLDTSDGGKVTQDLRFTAWEADDGTHYRFFASNNINGVRKDFRGRALKGTANGAGNANYRIPEGLKIPLPKGTLFPLSHTSWLIKQALAGERQVTNTVFDGADAEGAQHVTAFIGPKINYGEHITKEQVAVLGPLSQRPGWNIRMGFYELDSQNSVPDYEVEILQLDNGIVP